MKTPVRLIDVAWKPHAVYRLYDGAEELLYVGSTSALKLRVQAHRCKPWGKRITRVEYEMFDGAWSAVEYERRLIYTLDPPFNTHWTPTRDKQKGRRKPMPLDVIGAGVSVSYETKGKNA